MNQQENVASREAVSAEQFHARLWPNKRHKIIRNRVALVAEESVSAVSVGTEPTPTGDPPMRVYIIGNEGINLCREPPAAVNEGEIRRPPSRSASRATA